MSVGVTLVVLAKVFLTPLSGGTAHEGRASKCCEPDRRFRVVVDDKIYEGKAEFVRGADGMGFITDGTRLYPMARPGRSGVARVLLQEPGGDYFRCEYQFSDNGSRGLGQCTRADGQKYDLSLK